MENKEELNLKLVGDTGTFMSGFEFVKPGTGIETNLISNFNFGNHN